MQFDRQLLLTDTIGAGHIPKNTLLVENTLYYGCIDHTVVVSYRKNLCQRFYDMKQLFSFGTFLEMTSQPSHHYHSLSHIINLLPKLLNDNANCTISPMTVFLTQYLTYQHSLIFQLTITISLVNEEQCYHHSFFLHKGL